MLSALLPVHVTLVHALTTASLLFSILAFGNDCALDVYSVALYLSALCQWQDVLS